MNEQPAVRKVVGGGLKRGWTRGMDMKCLDEALQYSITDDFTFIEVECGSTIYKLQF